MFGKKPKKPLSVAPIPDDRPPLICDPSDGVLYRPPPCLPLMDYTPEQHRALTEHKPGHFKRQIELRTAMEKRDLLEKRAAFQADQSRQRTRETIRDLLRNSAQFQALAGMLAQIANVDDERLEAMEHQAAQSLDEPALRRDAEAVLEDGHQALPPTRRPRSAGKRPAPTITTTTVQRRTS